MTSDWTLEGFEEHFEAWTSRENPSPDLRVIVLDWIMTRHENPYRGVKREPGFDNLWHGRVPDSGDGRGNVVTCSYWIREATGTVACNSIATLGFPA